MWCAQSSVSVLDPFLSSCLPADVLGETRWGLGIKRLEDLPVQNTTNFLLVSIHTARVETDLLPRIPTC